MVELPDAFLPISRLPATVADGSAVAFSFHLRPFDFGVAFPTANHPYVFVAMITGRSARTWLRLGLVVCD